MSCGINPNIFKFCSWLDHWDCIWHLFNSSKCERNALGLCVYLCIFGGMWFLSFKNMTKKATECACVCYRNITPVLNKFSSVVVYGKTQVVNWQLQQMLIIPVSCWGWSVYERGGIHFQQANLIIWKKKHSPAVCFDVVTELCLYAFNCAGVCQCV